jgi:hypothetical protein
MKADEQVTFFVMLRSYFPFSSDGDGHQCWEDLKDHDFSAVKVAVDQHSREKKDNPGDREPNRPNPRRLRELVSRRLGGYSNSWQAAFRDEVKKNAEHWAHIDAVLADLSDDELEAMKRLVMDENPAIAGFLRLSDPTKGKMLRSLIYAKMMAGRAA